MPRLVLALVVAVPLVAFADASPPPAEPARWSIGAAATLFELSFGFNPGLLGQMPVVPAVSASLERRVAPATWLVFAVSGTLEDERADPALEISPFVTTTDASTRGGYLAGGVRREITRAAAPVALSLFALVEVGSVHQDRTSTVNTGGGTQFFEDEVSASLVGISAGAAVERALAAGLSVRISSTLLRASSSWERIDSQPGGSRDARTVSAGIAIAPRLELRLAF